MTVSHSLRCLAALSALSVVGVGCTTTPTPCPVAPVEQIEVEIHRRAETERAAQLAQQVKYLRADLAQAEEALVIAESGLTGTHSRADAVSSLAEARIQVERAAERGPWRSQEISEARSKLAEASRQIGEGHFGSALFFVYRAQRTAEIIEAEAAHVYRQPEVQFIGARRVNMRSGPSNKDPVLRTLEQGTPVFGERDHEGWRLVRASTGDVGWVYQGLLRK